jgi:superfamily I DNA/RNA helicase
VLTTTSCIFTVSSIAGLPGRCRFQLGSNARAALTAFLELITKLRFHVDSVRAAHLLGARLDRNEYRRAMEADTREGAFGRLEHLNGRVAAAQEFDREAEGSNISALLAQVILRSDGNRLPTGTGAVSLLTLHAANGPRFSGGLPHRA